MKFMVDGVVMEFDSRFMAQRKHPGCTLVETVENLVDTVEMQWRELELLEREAEQYKSLVAGYAQYIEELESAVRTAASLGSVLRKRK